METVNNIKAYATEHGIQFLQAHGPSDNPLSSQEAYDVAVRRMIRSIEVCGQLGIPNIVIHPGFRADATKEEWFEANRKFFRELIPAMEKIRSMYCTKTQQMPICLGIFQRQG